VVERVAAREPEVRAWAFFDPELVLRYADDADRGTDAGGDERRPLRGVPVGVKDLIDTADMPTSYGSDRYRGHRPRLDAACVTALRLAGALVAGKTVTTELAMWSSPVTRNPLRPSQTPGGSSSGSAAAVADHLVPAALGTQ
jgi:Asp-tRNA(Asn)/Glu-tRNA(Gln) amidotransferase A subunit family amidase